jgi:cyanophycinase
MRAHWNAFAPRLSAVILLSFLGTGLACVTAHDAPASAPPLRTKGHLLIVGGGPIPPAVVARFLELAGGPGRARIAVLPMASEDPEAGVEMTEELTKMGAAAERIVLDRTQADTDRAAARLAGATGVWFGGGDQARLTAALGATKTEAAIHEVFRRGGVIGGTSAGAAVMTTPMLTGDERFPGGDRPPAKESSDAYMTIARDNVVTTQGLSLLPGAIVDQHFVRRRRNNRLVSLVLEHPDLIAVGIDESTALEVHSDGIWEVLGSSVAVVFDARRASITPKGAPALGAAEVRMSILPAGSRYDPRSGRAELPSSH